MSDRPLLALRPETASALRDLYTQPSRVAARVSPEGVARLLGLARLVTGAEAAAVRLAGGEPEGDATAAATLSAPPGPGAARVEGEGPDAALVLPLALPLHPSGEGPRRTFGAVALRPPPAGWEERADLVAAHLAAPLVGEAVERSAEVDPLTGLLTRSAFERAMAAAAQRFAGGEPAALLMLDADDLRQLNVDRGYRAGDELLRTIAAAAAGEAEAAAPAALAGRYGGDELALLLPGLDAAGATEVGERLCAAVRSAPGFGDAPPTVSVGAAAAPEHADAADELVFRADQALAAAKEYGKGRVVVWRDALRSLPRRDRLAGILTGDQARDYRNVEALLEAASTVTGLAPLDETLTAIVDRCVRVAGAERGLLLFRTAEGPDAAPRWRIRLARGRRGEPLEARDPAYAASLAEAAFQEGRAVSRIADEGISPSADALGLKAVLCAPLRGEDVPDGAVYVDAAAAVGRFDRPTIAFFGALADQLTTALRNATLYGRLLERTERLRADVQGREEELARLKELWVRSGRPSDEARYEELVGDAPAMREVFALLKSLEGSLAPVLVEGESGTGKELIARAIHRRSPRAERAFVTVNCAAIAPTLFESELFGHVKGAFTGAHADRVGLIEAADGGTLFLDEVGELPLEAQAKLLRVLEEGRVRRVGATAERPVDIRLVAATNRDLRGMTAEGAFREDLYYRLAVFRLAVPALRERPTDIPLLARHLLAGLRARGVEVGEVAPAAVQELVRRPWRGNVRELGNALERAATLAGGGDVLPEHLEPPDAASPEGLEEAGVFALGFQEAKAAFATLYVKHLVRQEGSVPKAAKKAGASRTTFYRLLQEAEEPPTAR